MMTESEWKELKDKEQYGTYLNLSARIEQEHATIEQLTQELYELEKRLGAIEKGIKEAKR